MCEDKIFPFIHFFAKGYGKGNDPKRGYILTFVISLLFILIGELNAISPIISNFFMASFSLVNMACFHASFVGSPSFRPTFRFYNQWISLITGLACIGIMFFLDWISALVTVFIMGVIFLYVSKKAPDVNWGSSTRSHVYNQALFNAIKLNYVADHVKNFRPSILLLTGNPSARIPLVEFANHITRHRSLLLLGHIVNTEIPYYLREKVVDSQYRWMARRKIKAFYILLEAENLAKGAKIMFQTAGLGAKLSPNIVMLGYKSSWRECIVEDLIDYYNVMLNAMSMSIGICMLRIQEGLDFADFFEDVNENNPSNTNPSITITVPSENGQVNCSYEEEDEEDTAEEKVTTTPKSPNKLGMSVSFTRSTSSQSAELRQQHVQQKLHQKKVENIKSKFVSMLMMIIKVMILFVHLALIPQDTIYAINQFNERQRDGPIDIWWLAEDGGLTILIPYLLNINEIWAGCYIRLFCLADTTEHIETIKSKYISMTHILPITYYDSFSLRHSMQELMDRLRIPYTSIHVYAESDLEISDEV